MSRAALPEVVDTHAEAEALPLAPLVVRRPLEALLDEAGLGEGPVEVERLGEGHSNVTFELRRGGERYVLRRPPRPPLPPSAHDVLREARLLRALAGTPARVPRVLLACADERVLGVPFYLMERLDGCVLTTALPPALDTPGGRARIGEELVDALADLHAVDWPAGELAALGRPGGYLERQLRRFSGLWEQNRTRELPLVDEVGRWLAAHRPESGPATVVHGDYRLGNALFAAQAPARLVAVLDWELATIGDPLADVGYLTATWSAEGSPATPLELSPITRQAGFATPAELVRRYEARSGRTVEHLRWYQALALWKGAVFLEGNYRRQLAGTVDDPFYETLGEGVPVLAEAAHALTRADAA